MQSYLQSEMFLSNSVDMMKNLLKGELLERAWLSGNEAFKHKTGERESIIHPKKVVRGHTLITLAHF